VHLDSPVTRTPAIRSFIRLNTRRSVDLPQPDGPMMAVIFLGAIAKETSMMAWKSP